MAPPYGLIRSISAARSEMITERQHLDRERLVDLDGIDVVDVEPGLARGRFSVAGIGPMPINSGSTPAKA